MYIEWVIAWTTPYLIGCSPFVPVHYIATDLKTFTYWIGYNLFQCKFFFLFYTLNVHDSESHEFEVCLAMDCYTFSFLFFSFIMPIATGVSCYLTQQPTLKVLVYMNRHLIKVNEQVNENLKNKSMFRKKNKKRA